MCSAWTTVERIQAACPPAVGTALEELTDEEIEEAALAASHSLWELSGRRYPGLCTDIVWPCPRTPGVEADGWVEPAGWNASWGWYRSSSSWCGGCSEGPTCGGCCSSPSQIKLGNRPIIGDSVAVEIDGEALASTSWQILDGVWLVRVDGERWPCCQNLAVADGSEGSWSVAYAYGRQPPITGVRAATALARELLLECVGSSLCRLPARVSTVTRQQTTMAILDPQEFLGQGLTGLPSVDRFLADERYGRSHRMAAFVNPDRPRYVRRITDGPGS